MVRAFDMNPQVGGSSPPQSETFFVSKTLTLSQEHPFVSKMNAVTCAQLTFQMSTLPHKFIHTSGVICHLMHIFGKTTRVSCSTPSMYRRTDKLYSYYVTKSTIAVQS